MARIKTTPMVRFALWALRIYLLVLLVLIGIKFTRVFSASHKQDNADPSSATVTAGARTHPPPSEVKP